MDIKIQIIIAVGVVLALGVLVNMVRKRRIELSYALTWLLVGVGVLVLDCFPVLITFISRLVGIANPVNMLFFFGFCFSLIIIFVLTMAVSKMSIKIKELAQELALYKKQNEETRV